MFEWNELTEHSLPHIEWKCYSKYALCTVSVTVFQFLDEAGVQRRTSEAEI